MKYSPRKRDNTGNVDFPPTFLFCDMVKIRVVPKKETERTQKECSDWTHKDSGWINIALKEMLDTKYLRLVNNVDLHTRSAKLHLFCYCNIVGRHRDLKYKNAKVGGNGDHTSNSAVAHMKAYKSVKYYLQLTLVNQNEVVISKS